VKEKIMSPKKTRNQENTNFNRELCSSYDESSIRTCFLAFLRGDAPGDGHLNAKGTSGDGITEKWYEIIMLAVFFLST
jgi:hypothetical protein